MCFLLNLAVGFTCSFASPPSFISSLNYKILCSFRHLSVNGHIIFRKELVNNSHLPRLMAEYGFVRAFWKSELYPEYFIHKAALIIFFSLVGY